jgi:hypothetical protein
VDVVDVVDVVGVRQYGPESDERFSDTSTLEDDKGFPLAFLAFLQFLYDHRPPTLRDALLPPANKGAVAVKAPAGGAGGGTA